MKRTKMGKTESGIQYIASRSTKLIRAQEIYLYNRLVDANNQRPAHEQVPMLADDLRAYCRIATHVTFQNLKTVDGEKFDMPSYQATDEAHLDAFEHFLNVDDGTMDSVLTLTNQLNNYTAPRELLPESELTDEELSDPSS